MNQKVLIDFVFAICIGNIIFVCSLHFYLVWCFAIKEIKIIYVVKLIYIFALWILGLLSQSKNIKKFSHNYI